MLRSDQNNGKAFPKTLGKQRKNLFPKPLYLPDLDMFWILIDSNQDHFKVSKRTKKRLRT